MGRPTPPTPTTVAALTVPTRPGPPCRGPRRPPRPARRPRPGTGHHRTGETAGHRTERSAPPTTRPMRPRPGSAAAATLHDLAGIIDVLTDVERRADELNRRAPNWSRTGCRTPMLSRPIAAGSDRGAGSRYFPRSLCAVASWCSASTLPGARASSRARIDGRHPLRPASAAVPLSRPQPRTAGTTVRATGDPRWRSECQGLIAGGPHRCPESRIGERRRWTGVLPVGPRPAARASKMAACHWAHPVGDENHDAGAGIGSNRAPDQMRDPGRASP